MIKFLIVVFFSFLSTFGIVFIYYKFINAQVIKLRVILFFLIGVIISIINMYYETFLQYISFFIYFPIMFYLIKPEPFKKLLYYVMIIWVYGMIGDMVVMMLLSLLLSLFNYDILNNLFLAEHISTLVVFLFLMVISYIKPVKDFTNNFYLKLRSIKYYDLLLFIFSIFILIVAIIMLFNIQYINFSFVLGLLITVTIITILVLLKFKIYELENEKYLKTLRENNDFYIKIEDEHRIFRHNLNAKLLSIKSVSNSKSSLLIDDLLKEFNKNVDFSNHIKGMPYGLNGIIYQKLYPYLKDLNIKIYIDIDYDIFDVLKPRRYNVLVEKIILSLDNAIESSLISKDKILIVNLFDENDNIIVEIKNTFESNIDIDELGKKNYSSKGLKRGLGLFYSFRDNEVLLNVTIVNDLFVSKIKTKKNK